MAQVRVTMMPGWQRALRLRLRRAENRLAEAITADARRMAPVDTGDLESTIKARGNRVYVGTDHWADVEFGTVPHTIYPRAKKALYWPGAAHPVKRVRHPGTAAQPFMRPALRRHRTLRDLP